MPPYDKLSYSSAANAFFTTTPLRPTSLVTKSDAQIAQERSAAQSEADAWQHTADLRASQKRLAERRVAEAKKKVEALKREQASREALKDTLDKFKREQERQRDKLSGTLLIEAYGVRYLVRNVDLSDATNLRIRGEYKPVSALIGKGGHNWSPRGVFLDYTVIEKLCG